METGVLARGNIGKLWSKAAAGPVTVLSDGLTVAVVISPTDFDKLTARCRGVKAGFAKRLFAGVDMNALLETNLDDVFEDYHRLRRRLSEQTGEKGEAND